MVAGTVDISVARSAIPAARTRGGAVVVTAGAGEGGRCGEGLVPQTATAWM